MNLLAKDKEFSLSTNREEPMRRNLVPDCCASEFKVHSPYNHFQYTSIYIEMI